MTLVQTPIDANRAIRLGATTPGSGDQPHMTRTLILVAALFLFAPVQAEAANRNAASCARADVLAAYNSAVDGDTIVIPAGDCRSSNTWGSYINVLKRVAFQGAGQGKTLIGISGGGAGFFIQHDGVDISAMTLDCRNSPTSNSGIILIGNTSTCPLPSYRDWRIHHNTIDHCGSIPPGSTGNNAISIQGNSYGVIDHNTFNGCNSECIDISNDGVAASTRSTEFGQYDNGTTFVEDNAFNVTEPGGYENVIDGNSGQRFTFRHNTINVMNGTGYNSAIVSTHETCVLSTGSSTSCGDAGSLAYEMYENTINLNSSGTMRDLGIVRGGKALIYNNHIVGTGLNSSRYDVTSWLSNYRSFAAYGATPTYCTAATHARGYSGACHQVDGSFKVEGLEPNKTTLSSAVTATQITVPLTSVAGFSANGLANGFSILVDSEQIDYTAVSGGALIGAIRGANGTRAAAHSAGAPVSYLKFGVCLDQVNNVRIWNNDINGSVTTAMNNVYICGFSNGCVGESGPDYTSYDIQSFAQRPNNWQYQTGVPYSYTPYPYPHPLVTGTLQPPPSPPQNLRLSEAATAGLCGP